MQNATHIKQKKVFGRDVVQKNFRWCEVSKSLAKEALEKTVIPAIPHFPQLCGLRFMSNARGSGIILC